MPILRAQKESLVENLISELNNSRVALVISYTNLKSQNNEEIRTRAFNEGAKIKMISNNLLRIVLEKIGRSMDIPQKPLALTYGFKDEATAAKMLVDFSKETETLEVLGGWIDGKFFDAVQVKTLAALPSKEVLQSQVVGRLKGLIQGLAYSLNYPLQKFAYVIKAIEATKE